MYIKSVFVFVFLSLLTACQSSSSDKPARLVLKDVNIVDINGSGAKQATLTIEGDRIASIETSDGFKARSTDTVLELSGYHVIPGLINGHVHFGMADDLDAVYPALLKEGVTGIRDLGGPAAPMRAFSAVGVQSPGTRPDVYYSGTLAGPEFRQDPRIAPLIEENGGKDPGGIWFVERNDDIDAFVKAAKAEGAHGLKLYSSLTPEQLDMIVRSANEHQLKVWTHAVIFPANATDVINSKPTEIIHTKGLISVNAEGLPSIFMQGVREWVPKQNFDVSRLDFPRFQNAFKQMATDGIALNPALIADGDVMMKNRPLPPWMSNFRDWACEATRQAQKAGVNITAGTDFDGGPGLLRWEMKRLTECGLSPLEALRAATFHNAIVLGVEKEVGLVAEGLKANLVVLQNNPTDNLDALDTIHLVIKDGIIVD